MTPTIKPYTPKIPAMITGTQTLRTPSFPPLVVVENELIPTPLLAVPYAEPKSFLIIC